MIKSSLRSLSSLALLITILSGCGTMQTSDWEANIVLPGSRDCFGVKVMSKERRRIPRAECEKLIRRAIFITSENYKMLKTDVQNNCQFQQCQQITGAADGLFIAIDQALQKLPGGP